MTEGGSTPRYADQVHSTHSAQAFVASAQVHLRCARLHQAIDAVSLAYGRRFVHACRRLRTMSSTSTSTWASESCAQRTCRWKIPRHRTLHTHRHERRRSPSSGRRLKGTASPCCSHVWGRRSDSWSTVHGTGSSDPRRPPCIRGHRRRPSLPLASLV